MPEEIEVETERIDEQIKEQLEREGGSLLKTIALTTALFAALAAVAALRAGGTVNEALLLKTEATRLQAEASDQWSAYQAKGIKSAIQQAAESSWIARANRRPPPFPMNDSATRANKRTWSASPVTKNVSATKDRSRRMSCSIGTIDLPTVSRCSRSPSHWELWRHSRAIG